MTLIRACLMCRVVVGLSMICHRITILLLLLLLLLLLPGLLKGDFEEFWEEVLKEDMFA